MWQVSGYHCPLAKRKQLKRGRHTSIYVQNVQVYFERLQNLFCCVFFLPHPFLIPDIDSLNIFRFQMEVEKNDVDGFSVSGNTEEGHSQGPRPGPLCSPGLRPTVSSR